MKSKKVGIKLGGSGHQYKIEIGHNILSDGGKWAKKCLPATARKVTIISNRKVFGLYGAKIRHSLQSQNFAVNCWLMGDGEKYKSWRSVEQALKFFGESGLSRSDVVIALGGGVVGDLAGFAAALYLRGIAFLQIPTTFLAMIDSSVGGKTGVNSTFGKNLIGAFHQPHGVLIDVETLQTLPQRELVAGFCEAVKHGAISSRKLFDQTSRFLKKYSLKSFKNHFSEVEFIFDLENLLAAQISFKAEIVANDEREDVHRTDGRSRKVLNFGHTLAHALEKVTDFKYFKHGEAVGYGILFAAELAKKLDILEQTELKLLNDVLCSVGVLPDTRNISPEKVFELFVFDKKKIGEHVQFVLIEKIGKPVIISGEKISETIIRQSLQKILHANNFPSQI